MKEWTILFVMHNLSVSEPIEGGFLAIVNKDDERVSNLLINHDCLKDLIGNFSDQFQSKHSPSILIRRTDAPESLNKIEGIVGFRNIIALSTIIRSWEDALVRDQVFLHTFYSNYFDIYPIYPSKDYKYLLTNSPSLTGLDDRHDEFHGQSSPELAGFQRNIEFDDILFKELMAKWKQSYVKTRSSRKIRSLFRSLEIAYQACALPFDNFASLHDYGTSLALWTSAFEVLAWPERSWAGVNEVLDILAQAVFDTQKLNRNVYKVKIKNKTRKVNLIGKLYHQINNARNDFLHGNNVSIKKLKPFGKNDLKPLNYYAPLIYKVALCVYLGRADFRLDAGDDDSMKKYIFKRKLEEGLLSAIKKKEA